MLNTIQQFNREIINAKRILIVTPGISIDSITSVAALLAMCEKLGKVAEGISLSPVPTQLNFLPVVSKIKNKVSFGRDYVISLNISKTGAESLSYKIEDKQLNIYITPKTDAEFGEKDVTLKRARMGYDLVITVNAQDLTRLGDIFNKNPEIFYNATVINIDHDPANENFGKINLVNIHAASTTQVLFEATKLFEQDGKNLLDENLATTLLTGLIAETESFQTYSVTPEVMKAASELFEHGGKQQDIVRHLFRTKELGTLNLWGQILATLEQDEQSKLAWSIISAEDFEKSHAAPEDIEGALKELLSSIPSLEVAFILFVHNKQVHGRIFAPKNQDALAIASNFPYAHGNSHMAEFMIPETTLEAAKIQVLEQIHKKIPAR